jgi:hypothetical protein
MIIAMRHIKLAIAFVALNVLDAILTISAMNKGGVAELNPIARTFLEQSNWKFWAFKINTALIFVVLLLVFSNRFPHQTERIFTGLVIGMSGICLFNIISLY